MNQGFARDLSVVMNKNVLMNAYNKKADMVAPSSHLQKETPTEAGAFDSERKLKVLEVFLKLFQSGVEWVWAY